MGSLTLLVMLALLNLRPCEMESTIRATSDPRSADDERDNRIGGNVDALDRARRNAFDQRAA